MEADENKICNERLVHSFEESFGEYKRRVSLSRWFLVLSFLLVAVAIIFSFITITLAVALFILAFYFNLISKKHYSIALLAERFIRCEF